MISDLHHYANVVLDCLEIDGYEARIAGGAVRDIVMGIEPKDFDIATTATPEQVIKGFKQRGFKVIETGLQHGTVTVVFEIVDLDENGLEIDQSFAFEVTTLRLDKKTDGRHAEVEFITDWKADAARRDFTMNAMYMNKEGDIFDYFGGHEDIVAKRVRFVGNAEDRIKEDYLRIMRYYRFMTKFEGVINFNHTDLDIIEKNWEGLKQVSGERIWSELKQILKSDRYYTVLGSLLNRFGNKLFGATNIAYMPDSHYMVRFLGMFSNVEIAERKLSEFFKGSTEEAWHIQAYGRLFQSNNYEMFKLYRTYPEIVMNVLPSVTTDRAKNFLTYLHYYPNWQFPYTGKDLLGEGFKTGSELGKELEKRNREWAERQF